MVLKNLLRRKGRTLLTILGIGIGVAAIIALGALADGIDEGYSSVLSGSQADLVLSDPDAMDLTLSTVDEEIGDELVTMPEVASASGMLQGIVQTEESPYFFIFGYPEDSFVLGRFQIIEGASLYSREADMAQGTPLILGSVAAESLNKEVGDTIRLTGSSYRIVGIYQTGDALEEGGAVLRLVDAQALLGKQRKVSVFYIQLNERASVERLEARVERRWPRLGISTAEELADRQITGDSMRGFMWAIAALAIVIGGVGMMNAQLMSVFERTREIGVLRAVGWRSIRVLLMILGESIAVGLLGGLVGVGLGYLFLSATSDFMSMFGASTSTVRPGLLVQAFIVVGILGLVGGVYPAWRASRMQPVEALRYEGGSGGGDRGRLPVGGMAAQGLWRRKARTFLTLGVIGITVGAIMLLDAISRGFSDMMTQMIGGAELMVRQADAADMGYAFIDERIGDQIAALPGVDNVSGSLFTAIAYPETAYFIIQGYAPRESAIRRFNVVEGEYVTTNREIMLGRTMADAVNVGVGDVLTLGESRFRVVGIYESGTGWEELGGVITLHDAQAFAGRPRKVTFFAVDVTDSTQAREIAELINTNFPEAHAALAGEFADQLPDLQNSEAMLDGISIMAILVGGIGVMNTMLMAVLERTREIGVLRALGWRRKSILSLILREAWLLGVLGGVAGVGVAFGLNFLLGLVPMVSGTLSPIWSVDVFLRAAVVAIALGLAGGLYPAFRATLLQPVEALRYE